MAMARKVQCQSTLIIVILVILASLILIRKVFNVVRKKEKNEEKREDVQSTDDYSPSNHEIARSVHNDEPIQCSRCWDETDKAPCQNCGIHFCIICDRRGHKYGVNCEC